MANHLPSIDPPRRRVQFTVRTLIGAAFLISLFGAASALLTEEAKLTAIALLVWVTFAGLYWTLGAAGPLVALPVGTMVSATCWSLTFVFGAIGGISPFYVAGVTVPMAFGWGILFSLILVLSRILGYTIERLRSRLSRVLGRRPRLRQEAKHVLSAWGVARNVLFTRLLLSGLLAIQAIFFPLSGPLWALPVTISVYLDTPLFPIFILLSFSGSALLFLLVMAVLYCPLYAGTGWIVGFILTRMSRPAVPTASRATNTSPVDEEGSASCESPQPPTT